MNIFTWRRKDEHHEIPARDDKEQNQRKPDTEMNKCDARDTDREREDAEKREMQERVRRLQAELDVVTRHFDQ